MGGFFTGLFGSRPADEETADQHAERLIREMREAEFAKARQMDAESQKECDDWNAARKAEVLDWKPSLVIKTNAQGQRFLAIGNTTFELPAWLIVGARIKDHGGPKYLDRVFNSSPAVIRGGYSVIIIEMASGRQWEWHVAWCHAEVALDGLNYALAECRRIA